MFIYAKLHKKEIQNTSLLTKEKIF